MTSNLKNTYENKVIGKLGVGTTNAINKNLKKIEEPKKYMFGNERPQSANIIADRKKQKNVYSGGEDLIITNNIGKKRYPSTNPRDDIRLK
jgi:hypothetical protein